MEGEKVHLLIIENRRPLGLRPAAMAPRLR